LSKSVQQLKVCLYYLLEGQTHKGHDLAEHHKKANTMQNCDSVLKSGVFDTVIIDSNKTLSENLTSWLESVEYLEFRNQQNSGLKIGFPIKGIPVSIDGSFSEDEFKEWKKQVDLGSSRQFTEEETMRIFSMTASPAILDAWSNCISTQAAGTGLRSDVEIENGGMTIVFTVRWVPNSMSDYPPTVVAGGFQISGATPQGEVAQGMEIPLSGFSVILSRIGASGVAIVLNTSKGAVTESIPPLRSPAPVLPPIQLKVFSATGSSASHPSTTLTVPPDYKILCGGGRVNWSAPGSLLTACYPKDTQTWVAKAKDHLANSPATIDVWAIAIHDPNDLWEIDIFSSASPSSNHPVATAIIGNGYVLTGGGAIANWSGNGSLLTASYPEGTTGWTAKSKDHVNPESTSITAFAIGMRARNGVSGPSNEIFSATSNSAIHPLAEVSVGQGFRLVGGGAHVNWRGNGNLLTASYPSGPSKWQSASKDHFNPESCTITTYAIGIKP
jgi:hypothetical protein